MTETSQDRQRFAMDAYSLTYNALKARWPIALPEEYLPRLAHVGAAIACLETGWGKSDGCVKHNNLYGIKPVGHQPAIGPIRKFQVSSDSAEAWAYLALESTYYASALHILYDSIKSRTTHEETVTLEWARKFAAVYNRENREYWADLYSILFATRHLAMLPVLPSHLRTMLDCKFYRQPPADDPIEAQVEAHPVEVHTAPVSLEAIVALNDAVNGLRDAINRLDVDLTPIIEEIRT